MIKLLSPLLCLCLAVLAAPSHAQAVVGNAKAGEQKIAACIGCHGIKGYQASFPEVHRVPMISGQSAPYIVSALNAYKRGERRHPTMRGIAETLSDQDMADMAAYYEQHGKDDRVLPATPARQPTAAVAALLQKGACISCHGENFSKPLDPSYPKIAGQHADYLAVALRSYKLEGNNAAGRANGIMGGIAKQFTNAELKAMANYIGSLPGELKTVPQSKFK